MEISPSLSVLLPASLLLSLSPPSLLSCFPPVHPSSFPLALLPSPCNFQVNSFILKMKDGAFFFNLFHILLFDNEELAVIAVFSLMKSFVSEK